MHYEGLTRDSTFFYYLRGDGKQDGWSVNHLERHFGTCDWYAKQMLPIPFPDTSSIFMLAFEKYLKCETRTLVRTFGWEEENLKERRENVSIGRRRNWIGFHRISTLSPAAARDIPQRHAWRTNTALRLREIVTWRVYHRQAVHGRRR